jgi:hypothetical protein
LASKAYGALQIVEQLLVKQLKQVSQPSLHVYDDAPYDGAPFASSPSYPS